jgi:hypothetical protein
MLDWDHTAHPDEPGWYATLTEAPRTPRPTGRWWLTRSGRRAVTVNRLLNGAPPT